MNDLTNLHEKVVANAFNKQAYIFDELYAGDSIIQYKRKRVREFVLNHLKPRSAILELNAGTGDDAIFFAQQGHTVHATDISDIMQAMLKEKAQLNGLKMNVSNELCSYTQLENLSNKGPFDLIFSNFAGLNCTNELSKVLQSFDQLLKPGGFAILVLLPKFCLWELLLLFKGKFKTALRRMTGSHGARAHIEGETFRCWYYNPSFIRKNKSRNFEVVSIEGLCTIVPPSYLQGFAEKHPAIYRLLVNLEEKWKTKWPWKTIGDYYIIALRKSE